MCLRFLRLLTSSSSLLEIPGVGMFAYQGFSKQRRQCDQQHNRRCEQDEKQHTGALRSAYTIPTGMLLSSGSLHL